MTVVQEARLKIPAIHCEACVTTITRTLEALPTVQVGEANPETKLVSVRFDGSEIGLDRVREALDEIGFSADG